MGIAEEKFREVKRLKLGENVCGMVAEQRQPQVLADLQRSDAPGAGLIRSLGIQAYACNPLIVGDQLLGTLSFGARNRTHFSPDELEFLQTVSQYTAIAVNRIRMEQELVEQRRLYQSVTDNATLALFIIDERQQCVFMNPAAETLTGFTLDEVRGKALHEVIHHTRPDGSHFPVSECPIDRALPTSSKEQGEEVFVHKDGHFYDVEFTASPVRDSTGQAIGTVIQVQDITERKRTEERLRRIERMAAAGQLAASLAHEINNPLSSVINVLYLLDRSPGLAGEAKKFISMAEGELARVSRIVKQSLAYYRVGAVAKEADLAGILEESLQIFSERFQRSGIVVRKKITPGSSVVGFADELRQVIDNVLLNAAEAMPTGGRLAVSVCRSCNWKNFERGVRLTIGDSGPGIAEEHWPRIFEPFFTTKQEKGTGLGLWVVRGIVLKHEGSIKIRSTKANGRSGTVVSIFLPTVNQAHHSKRPGTESAA
jgi:PAS domain S-box-containing protein